MGLQRLDKVLADLGIGSRKELKELIRAGRVRIDGMVCLKPEQKLDPERQTLTLDGKELGYKGLRYFMMDKPEDRFGSAPGGAEASGTVSGRPVGQGHQRSFAPHKRRRFRAPGHFAKILR